jgi:hypothetical protein
MEKMNKVLGEIRDRLPESLHYTLMEKGMLGGLRCGTCRYRDLCPREFMIRNGENCEKYLPSEKGS